MAERFDLSDLNPPQREAVLHEQGPLLVLAGAGSGKTRVITYRIARLLRDGVPAARILGVTFTNKAAREMRERLSRLVGRPASGVALSTFHALGLSILKEEASLAGLSPGFCIYDTNDQLSLVRELMRQVKVADRRLDAARVLDIVLRTKRQRLAEVQLDWGDDYELAAYDLYPRYLEQMRAFNAVDFDDLILRTQALMEDPDVRQRWGERYEQLLVDEYQDTSPDQLEMVRVLAGPSHNVCVVGDDDQSIYAWRGAAPDNILLFGQHFPGAREVVLEQNYRSTNHILSAANAVIQNNQKRKAKVLWSAAGDGDPVEVVACSDELDEAALVSERIGRLVYDGARYEDVAVLYRSNMQSQVFEEQLALESIPFRVVGGQAFFDRKEVRDALAYLSVAQNPYDEISLRRVINSPARGIGPASLQRLVEYAEAQKKGLWWALRDAEQVPDLPRSAVVGAKAFAELVAPAVEEVRGLRRLDLAGWATSYLGRTGLREAVLESDDAPSISARRLENLQEVVSSLARFGQSDEAARHDDAPLAAFLRAAALVRSPEEDDEAGKGLVTLMTLHSAKGLEFPFVFLVGMEEDLLPHKKTLETGADLFEERRLCYVGITRARRRLWITHARTRRRGGKPLPRTPSRFLDELPGGAGVLRRERDQVATTEEEADKLADDFFKKMRAQLGIDGE